MASGAVSAAASHSVFAALGAVITVGGVVLGFVAWGFPELPGGYPGPGLFPLLIAGLFVVFGIALTVQAAVQLRHARGGDTDDAGITHTGATHTGATHTGATHTGEPHTATDEDASSAARTAAEEALSGFDRTRPVAALLHIGAVLAAVIIFLVLDGVLGFLAAMTLVTAGLMVTLGRGIRTAIPVAVLTSCAVWYVFGTVLRVPLSPGPWGW